MLRNLISNVTKYTEDGHVWVRAKQTDEAVAVEVEDTGIGMDPGEGVIPVSGLPREYEGSGLGLAVTRQVLDQMEGTIDVETEPGQGICFTVWLPAVDEKRLEEAA